MSKDRVPYTRDFCFHPDMAEAHKLYQNGDKEAFSRAVKLHQEAVARGERFWEGDEGHDQALIEFVERKTNDYVNRTGDKRPESSEGRKKKFNTVKKHWTDIPLGIRKSPQDEEE